MAVKNHWHSSSDVQRYVSGTPTTQYFYTCSIFYFCARGSYITMVIYDLSKYNSTILYSEETGT